MTIRSQCRLDDGLAKVDERTRDVDDDGRAGEQFLERLHRMLGGRVFAIDFLDAGTLGRDLHRRLKPFFASASCRKRYAPLT